MFSWMSGVTVPTGQSFDDGMKAGRLLSLRKDVKSSRPCCGEQMHGATPRI
jgi:hypothetical protein